MLFFRTSGLASLQLSSTRKKILPHQIIIALTSCKPLLVLINCCWARASEIFYNEKVCSLVRSLSIKKFNLNSVILSWLIILTQSAAAMGCKLRSETHAFPFDSLLWKNQTMDSENLIKLPRMIRKKSKLKSFRFSDVKFVCWKWRRESYICFWLIYVSAHFNRFSDTFPCRSWQLFVMSFPAYVGSVLRQRACERKHSAIRRFLPGLVL